MLCDQDFRNLRNIYLKVNFLGKYTVCECAAYYLYSHIVRCTLNENMCLMHKYYFIILRKQEEHFQSI